jgi:adenylylsulfate kinase
MPVVEGYIVFDGEDDAEGSSSASRCKGATVWLTGLPSSGKTTLAESMAAELRGSGLQVEVEVLDGDVVRRNLTDGLGFSREDRSRNVARVGYVSHLLARHGVIVLVAVIAPYADARDAVRKAHAETGTAFAEVHVAAPVDVCRHRDVKGLYARHAAGQLIGLTGVDDPYEVPASPELRIATHLQSERQSLASLRDLLVRRGLIRGASRSLPFDSSRRFRSDVVNHAADAGDLGHEAGTDGVEERGG